MKKQILMRALIGAPIGVTVCTLITILFSLSYGSVEYFAAPYELIAECGSELGAVVLQTVFGMLYGAVWGGASVIWRIESWSLLKMTLSHLVLCSAVSLPIAYFLQWMPRSFVGVLGYFGQFFLIYAVIWVSQYSVIKRQIKRMNHRRKEKNQS